MRTLTELGVKSAKEGMHGDGDGLMLVVRASGKKSWLLRYQMKGARRDMGLGRYPEIGLKEARQKALDARRLVEGGSDPIEARRAARRAAKPVPTFGEIAALVIADAQAKTTNEKVKYQWARHLGPAYSGPLLDRPVPEITTLEIAAALAPIWRTKPEVARKTYPAIRRVFDRARIILRDEHGDRDEPEPGRVERFEGARLRGPAGTQPRPPSILALRPDGGIHGGASRPGGCLREGARISHLDERPNGRGLEGDLGPIRLQRRPLDCPLGESKGPGAPDGAVPRSAVAASRRDCS